MEIESGYLHIAQASAMKNCKKIIRHLIFGLIAIAVSGAAQVPALSLIVMLGVAALLFFDVLDAKSYKYVFYNDRVIVFRGVFTKHQDQVFLSKVLAVRYKQTVGGRIFNYGDVFVDQLGDNDFMCQCIAQPQKLVDALSPLVTRPSSRIF